MMNNIDILLIDLDDTVYPSSLNLWPLYTVRIQSYIREVLNIPAEEALPLQDRLFREFGTTLRGLQHEHDIDMHDYLAWVHDVDLSDRLFPDPELRKALQSLPQPKWIYTNASVAHAENVLKHMQLRDLFEDPIIDVVATAPYCKPQKESYEIALKTVGNPDPRRCLFLDDRAENLDTARELGIYTVQVKPKPDGTHPAITKLAELPEFLRQTSAPLR